VLRQAVTSNPGFRAAVSNIRSSRANIDVQRANYSPTVEFRANTGMDKNLLGVTGETYSSAMQVLLNWNLFKGGADEARIRQSHEQLYNATDLRDKACRDIRQQTAIAWNDIKKLKEQLGTSSSISCPPRKPATPTASSSTSASAACSTCSTPRTNSSKPSAPAPAPATT
jgi:outer membrane protein TolC